MKLKVTLVAVPVLALVFVAAAIAKSDGGAAKASPKAATIACGTTRTIGVAAPITGPVASLGGQQLDWAKYYVKSWNALKANKNRKIKIIQGDTQLAVDTAFAVKVAQSFASNSKVLAVVGPAGSQEVVASTAAYMGGRLGWISGSATRASLTDGHTDGVNRRGFFFRVVPNDNPQSTSVALFMLKKLNVKNVYIIDDQETYSQGLATAVAAKLKAKGVNVTRDSVDQKLTDFSSVIAKIPANTDIIYIPWQVASNAQALGQQLKAHGKNIKLFGSDGLYDPTTFKIPGSYDSFFPVSPTSPILKAFEKAHGGDGEFFGAPTYVATQVATMAITKACADGKATRAEVRKFIAKTNIPAKLSLLGVRVDFQVSGDLRHGGFGIYQIQGNGSYKPVG
jgi:branched-chain amino acid transport system substrate-binding protein